MSLPSWSMQPFASAQAIEALSRYKKEVKIKKQRRSIPIPASAQGFSSVKPKGKGFRPASENPAFFWRHVAERGALLGDKRIARLWIALETFPELRAAQEAWDVVLGKESLFRSQFLQEESFAADREYVLFITSSEKEII